MARERSAFAPIISDIALAKLDINIKTFERGKSKQTDIEAEFKKHKKDFSFEQLVVRVPGGCSGTWQFSGCAAPLFGAYTYYSTESSGSTISGNWTQNGTISASGGLTSASATGGSLISNVAVPDGTSQYEVKTKIALTQSGGTYISYLRGTSNAISSSSASGMFYSVELQNPTFSGSFCSCVSDSLQGGERSLYRVDRDQRALPHGVAVRAVYAASGQIIVYVDNLWYLYAIDTSITAGQPGVGVRGAPAGNGILKADLGPLDRIAPAPVNSQLIGAISLPNRIDMQWAPAADDVNGTGIAWYQLIRDGRFLANLNNFPTYAELTATAG